MGGGANTRIAQVKTSIVEEASKKGKPARASSLQTKETPLSAKANDGHAGSFITGSVKKTLGKGESPSFKKKKKQKEQFPTSSGGIGSSIYKGVGQPGFSSNLTKKKFNMLIGKGLSSI